MMEFKKLILIHDSVISFTLLLNYILLCMTFKIIIIKIKHFYLCNKTYLYNMSKFLPMIKIMSLISD